MRSLVALVKNIVTDTFSRRTRAYSVIPAKRFIMESLETRVLLSADPTDVAALIDTQDLTSEGAIVLLLPDVDGSGVDAVDVELDPDSTTGVEIHDKGEEEEEEGEGGDFIEHEAYDETYGEFDYDEFLEQELHGPLGGPGGAVVEDTYPTDALTNNNGGATSISAFTQSETTVIAFGNTVLVGFNDSGSTSGGTNKFTGFSRSTDGGLTFTDGGTLPTNPGGDAGDPVLAQNDTTGRVYFSTLGFSVSTIQMFRSDDGGLTWMAPVNATPGGSGEDKQWHTVDNFAGPGNGNVYLASRRFGGPLAETGIYFFRSTDNGNTFGPNGGTLITLGSQGAFVTVAPDHSVYVFWYAGTTIQMRKSTDQGLTFGAPVTVVSGLVPLEPLTGIRQGTAIASGFRSNSFPHAAINPVSGNIYVTYNNDGAGTDKADVLLVQSTDGGLTWGTPVKVNDDATTTDQWQPTLAVSPDGKKLGIFYSSRQEDPGNNLFKYYGRIADINPITGALAFTPSFAISDTPSLPEFGRDSLVVPIYMGDYNSADATDGFFHVSWSDNRDDLPNGAGRKDPNVYYKAIDLGLTVRSTLPALGSIVSSIPLTYTVNFSDPILTSSVSAADFTVDGVAASSFTINDPSQVTFNFLTAPFSTQGLHTMAMAAGSIIRDSVDLDGLAAFSGTFRYDAVQLQVSSTIPPVSGVFTLPAPLTYDVIFNELINPTSVQTWDLVVGGLTGAVVSAVTVLAGNTTARFTISGVVDQGTMTANIMAGAITDLFGNPNGAFTASYAVDLVTALYPTPLIAKNPLGSLIYDPSVTGIVNFAGDVDNFTLNIDPNQTISVYLTTPVGFLPLQPRIEVFDPNNVSLGFAIAPAAGQAALIQTAPTTIGGVYTFAVSGANSTTGSYTLQTILNSALELEGRVSGAFDNALTTETAINAGDSGFIQANGSHTAGSNAYIVGQSLTFPGIPVEFRDYFTFTLPAATPGILSAELRLLNPAAGYVGADANETYVLFDVSASPTALDLTRSAGDATGIAIFGDLGSGTTYGSRVVSAADNNTTVAIPLNAAAVAALNAAIGSTISFGGALTTLSGTGLQIIFSGSGGAPGTVQLVLRVNPAQNIDNSFINVGPPQAGAERGAVLGQTDVANYVATAVAPTFEDISATGTVITGLTNQDNALAFISPNFTFPFFSVNNTSLFVSSNGFLSFGGATNLSINTDLTTAPTQATIAPFWDDLHTGGGFSSSNVFYQVLGSGSNQHLTVQWNNVRFQSGGMAGDNITFQTQLYADGRIQFNYLDLVSGTAAGNNGGSATVGVKATGTQGANRLVLALNNGPNAFVGGGKSTLLTQGGDPIPDYYSFSLDAGETVTLAATRQTTPGNLTVELRDSNDIILATGVGGSRNLTSVVSDFTVATGGTYYARVTSTEIAGIPYSLVVTKNVALDREDNNTPATAQVLTGTAVLGSLLVGDINAIDSGWIASDGTHFTANGNYIVGQGAGSSPLQFRNYFTFNLPATSEIVAAELRLFNPTNGYISSDTTETYTLFDVFATPADLDANRIPPDATGMALFADLGSGTVYGTRNISLADNNTTIAIPLNAAAVAALNARAGSSISLGGAITTLSGVGQQEAFAFSSGAPGTVQLALQSLADDWYSITVPITAHGVRLITRTPGDGPGQFVNTLNPHIELYDNTGTTLIASGVTTFIDGRNEIILTGGLTPGGTYKVRVSRQGNTNGEYFLTSNFNFTPVLTNVTVGSPIDENGTATVSGTFSDVDPFDPHTVAINWGANEGSTTLTLGIGVTTFSASHQYLDDNPTGTLSDVNTIGVTVTDSLLGSDSESVNLTVNDVAPDVAAISGPSSGVRGQTLDFSSSFTDIGTLDTHEVQWDFGDGTVIDFHSITDPDALTASHVYTANGVYTVTLSIRDDDGGLASVTKEVTVTAVAIQVDPCDPDETALVVGGTTANDTIVFSPLGNGGDVVVTINDVIEGVFSATGHIIVYGQAGDDDVQVASSIALNAWFFGDAGNDRLKGGAAGSILLGGDGDDLLLGGGGRSILIGGRGKDRLVGAGGDDILIGGSTAYDQDALVLCAISEEWNSTDAYDVRVSELRLLLDTNTVIDDQEADSLTGSNGRDWFFEGLGDVVTRIQDDENIG